MSGLTALTLGVLAVGLALMAFALLFVRSAARTAAATRVELARLQARVDAPAATRMHVDPPQLQLAGMARASEATGARPHLVAAADPSPHS